MRLIYLSPVPWASFAQRPHKFVEWFHQRTQQNVLWIDPYPTRLPSLSDFSRASPKHAPESIPSWLTVLQPRSLPIEPLPWSGSIHRVSWHKLLNRVAIFAHHAPCVIGIGKPSELAIQILKGIPNSLSFYDAMDDFPAFYTGISRFSMKRREQKIISIVNKIFVSSRELQHRFKLQQDKLTLITNACADNALPDVEQLPPRPHNTVLGYVGTIGHWFDWELTIQMALQNPQATVRIIGPIFTPPPTSLPSNIELLPACSHNDAIQAMIQFSIGLIPFKQTTLTSSVDPIKYYEYRALGLPVISTSFGEMVHRGTDAGVFFAQNDTDLKQLVEKALHFQQSLTEIQSFRAKNTWVARFDTCKLL